MSSTRHSLVNAGTTASEPPYFQTVVAIVYRPGRLRQRREDSLIKEMGHEKEGKNINVVSNLDLDSLVL